MLSISLLFKAANEEIDDDYSGDDFIREEIERSASARGQQSNISFFAFTATPKYKTLQVFGDKDENGKPKRCSDRKQPVQFQR